MTPSVLGLPLEEALSRLRAAGIAPNQITEACAPRGNTLRGTLRVARVREDGLALVVSRFPDSAEENHIENT